MEYVQFRYTKGKAYTYVVANVSYGDCHNYFMFYPPAKEYVQLQMVHDWRSRHRVNGFKQEYFCAIEGGAENPSCMAPRTAESCLHNSLKKKKERVHGKLQGEALQVRYDREVEGYTIQVESQENGLECHNKWPKRRNHFPDLNGFAESYGMINSVDAAGQTTAVDEVGVPKSECLEERARLRRAMIRSRLLCNKIVQLRWLCENASVMAISTDGCH